MTTGIQTLFPGIRKFGAEEAVRSIETYEKGRLSIHQRNVIDQIDKTNQQLKIYLKKEIDSTGITGLLDDTRSSLNIVRDGVFVNKGTTQTQRNLSVSFAILTELKARMIAQKNRLDTYANDLVSFRDKIDSLSSDTAIYTFPPDSLAIVKYLQRISAVAYSLREPDSQLNKSINIVLDLKAKVDLMIYELNSSMEDVELLRKELSDKNFSREFTNIWGPVGFSRPLREIIQFSYAKEKLALNFYINDNKGKLVLIFFLILLASLFIHSLKKQLIAQTNLATDYKEQLVVRYPELSATIIVLSIFQFIFIDPPFIFSFWFWLISAVCLAFIFRKYITTFWMNFWLIMIFLFVLSSADNLLLQASRTERWLMLGLSFFGMVYGTYILFSSQKKRFKGKKNPVFYCFCSST